MLHCFSKMHISPPSSSQWSPPPHLSTSLYDHQNTVSLYRRQPREKEGILTVKSMSNSSHLPFQITRASDWRRSATNQRRRYLKREKRTSARLVRRTEKREIVRTASGTVRTISVHCALLCAQYPGVTRMARKPTPLQLKSRSTGKCIRCLSPVRPTTATVRLACVSVPVHWSPALPSAVQQRCLSSNCPGGSSRRRWWPPRCQSSKEHQCQRRYHRRQCKVSTFSSVGCCSYVGIELSFDRLLLFLLPFYFLNSENLGRKKVPSKSLSLILFPQ